MSNSAHKSRYDLFRKRHYISVIKQTVDYCTWLFGYKKMPFLFETENRDGELMYICRGKKHQYAIFYDYKQFKKIFGYLDFEGQLAYATLLIAHEMAHYYQMRQIDSPKPRESAEILEKWRANDENAKFPDECDSLLNFYMQPMELDAELFAYVFVAEHLNAKISVDFIDPNYLKEMEKRYVYLYGETNEELFGK